MSQSVERVCPGCSFTLPLEAFAPRWRGPYNKASLCRSCEGAREQRRRHGMTASEKEAVAISQGGCAICRTMETGKRGWVVDHDHRCCPGERSCEKCRRGVICTYCNSAMGYAKDDPARLRAMADYLDAFNASRQSSESVQRVSPVHPTNVQTNVLTQMVSLPVDISPVRYAHAKPRAIRP